MSRPPPHPPITTSASQSAALAYVPDFGRQSDDFLLDPQPPRQSQEGSPAQLQQQQSSPSNPRKRRAPESPPMAGLPSALDPGYGPSAYAAQGPQGELQPEKSSQPSAPKKSRTNTPWTPAEEQRLKTMRDAGNSWSEIAKTFPNRTEGSVKKHWYKDMHYADFAEDESAALLAAIKEYEASKWKVIGAKVGKPAKACEQYAKEHFSGRV
ncbi:MAG: hypothetical protein L6R36_005796 [Xanthoria steineri]|nr:MAG: hypothetical protein L6R36_005796 [Xanthoria steineri]